MIGGMKEMLYLCIEKSVITNNSTEVPDPAVFIPP